MVIKVLGDIVNKTRGLESTPVREMVGRVVEEHLPDKQSCPFC